MFGRKKKNPVTTLQPTHYEGLSGFKQSFPCQMTLEDDHVVFKSHEGNIAKLPYDRIMSIELLREEQFMSKYHNTNGKATANGKVMFRIIHYISSTGEEKYIALWDISFDSIGFYDLLEQRIKKTPTETIL